MCNFMATFSTFTNSTGYLLHVIANMDEMSLTFDMPPNRTINNLGEKTIKICTTVNEKNCITVVLTCAVTGHFAYCLFAHV